MDDNPKNQAPIHQRAAHSVHAPLTADQFGRLTFEAVRRRTRSRGRVLATLAMERLSQLELERAQALSTLAEIGWGWEETETGDDGAE